MKCHLCNGGGKFINPQYVLCPTCMNNTDNATNSKGCGACRCGMIKFNYAIVCSTCNKLKDGSS